MAQFIAQKQTEIDWFKRT